jgi:hypothetical protein
MFANAMIASATAVFWAGIDLASFRKNIMSTPEDMALAVLASVTVAPS